MFRARSSDHTESDVSILVLKRHIYTVKKRIGRFEDRFEQEKHYKVRDEGMLGPAGFSCDDWVESYCCRVRSSVFFP